MGIGTTFSVKAPKLVTFLKEIGIDIDSENGVFTERSNITLPSGEKAFFYDDDSMAKHIGKQALYDDEEFGMPRWLHGMAEGDSLVEWFITHLVDVGEEELIENFIDKQYSCIDFCQEAKEIVDRSFPEAKGREKIKELDDLIEEAAFLYLSCWGVPDFDYAYVEIKNEQAKIIGMHIAKYKEGNIFNHYETRDRKLLLHKKEILKLQGNVQKESLTIIPLEVYIKHGLAKIEIALCQGKKNYDKRESLKQEENRRTISKAMSFKR